MDIKECIELLDSLAYLRACNFVEITISKWLTYQEYSDVN